MIQIMPGGAGCIDMGAMQRCDQRLKANFFFFSANMNAKQGFPEDFFEHAAAVRMFKRGGQSDLDSDTQIHSRPHSPLVELP